MASKRVLLILGGMYHDFEGFATAMRPVLESAGHNLETTYDLDVLTRLDKGPWDVVMSYTSFSKHREGQNDTGPEALSEAQTSALTQWVRAGGGLLSVHSATVSGLPNPAMRALMGGVFVSHPPQFAFTVYPMFGPHPITQGVQALTVKDEFYVQDYAPDVAVHMVAMDRGVAHPMVWTRGEGRGLVAHIAMGHSQAVWSLDPYQRLLLQAIGWVTPG